MYIQNRLDSSKFNDYSPLQNHYSLISLKTEIAYFAYTNPLATRKEHTMSTTKLRKTGFRITFEDGETAIRYLQPLNSNLGKFLVHFRRPTDYENNGTT